MRSRRRRSSSRGVPTERIYLSMERNMQCGVGLCGHCQLGPVLVCRDGPVFRLRRDGAADGGAGAVMARRPKLAVWKFASCDGCQLTLLDCEDELLAVAGAVEIAYFPEATSAEVEGPYDLSLVEGSITTAARRRAHPRGPRAVAACWSRSAPAPPPAASRRCATSPTSTEFDPGRLRAARVHRARSRPRRRSPTTSRSTSSCAAARSTSEQLLER